MVVIANDNRGFLIAIVIVLALAVFSGGIRDRYTTTGYAGLSGSSGYAGHWEYQGCMNDCSAMMDWCLESQAGSGRGACYDNHLDCQRGCNSLYGR